jgi:hypothetical protein
VACADADLLAALVAGALSEDERAAIAHHAAACALCHEVITGLIQGTPSDPGAGPGDATFDGRGPGGVLRLSPGARVGRYVIDERIGVGGMGVVYAAVDSELERRVAVKLLRPDRDGTLATQGRERLLREARTLASLSHANVVTVFDVGTHDGHLFLAMELVDGGNFGAWLRRERRSTPEIVDRLLEAGRGLAAAHAAGVVHRDVKPDNILVGRDGRARVTDFGLARSDPGADGAPDAAGRAARDLTRTGTLLGTPAYMAPEQWQRAATGPATDQWAFCATLYEAVAGVRPFSVEDAAARTAQIAEGRLAAPAPGRTVPPWLRAIVVRGLRADPAERWPSMDAVVAALGRGRNRRRRLTRAIAVASGVAVAAVAIAVPLVVRGGATVKQDRRLDLQNWVDQRPGCNCPFSTCVDGRCLSVCDASNFVLGAPVPDINLPGRQEILTGASEDGNTILYLAGDGCAADHLYLARRRGGRFESIDLTPQLAAMGLRVFEACCSLAPDGSLIIAAADRTGFLRARIDGDTVLTPEAREFADLIPEPIAQGVVHFPVLSADQRTIYYRADGPLDEHGDSGPYDGVHVAVRSDPAVPFTPGRRISGYFARRYESVSATSSDGLTLFMASEFLTNVLFRGATTEEFATVHHTVGPARLPGWRTIPIEACTRLLTTGTPGGCHQEDIIYLDAIYSDPYFP